MAASLGDIVDRVVADLGCGTGRLGLGAAILGAGRVHLVDLDAVALNVARKAAVELRLENVKFHLMDVRDFAERVDTVVQNPPFGAQRRGADRPFLEKKTEIARVIYTMHNAPTRSFVVEYLRSRGWRVTHELLFKFPIRRMFRFHRRRTAEVNVVLIRAIKEGED